MEATAAWRKLLIDKKKVATSEEIRELARHLGKDEWRSLKYLQHRGFIQRILRGIFYVRSPEERELGKNEVSMHEMVAFALEKRSVKNWYFGLETALKLNLMTHEYFDIEYVITDSFRTTKTIKILDTNYRFLRRRNEHFGFGMKEEKNFRYSDPERTVLDIAYERYISGKDPNYCITIIKEFEDQLNMDTMKDHIEHYSRRFKALVNI